VAGVLHGNGVKEGNVMMSVCLAVQILSGWALIWMEMRKGPTALFFSTPIVLTAALAPIPPSLSLYMAGWHQRASERDQVF
jgi:hypothetical protein